MRARRSRVRRVAKWVGMFLCLGIVVLAIVSVRIRPLIGFRYGYVVARHGNVSVAWSAAENTTHQLFVVGLELLEVAPDFRFSLPTVSKVRVWGTNLKWLVSLPLWLLLLVLAAPTAYLWHRDRRFRFPSGHCQQCGYNLHGLTEPRCPECGTGFEPRGDAP